MRWRHWKTRKAVQAWEFDQEIAFHLEALKQQNMARGMSPDEAARRAAIEFGGREQVKQQVREVHTSALIEALSLNLRAALRFARRSPSFALTIVLTLGLGIGANSAVYSAIDTILLRPLPFPHADELVRVHQENFKNKNPESFVAPLRLEDWRRLNSTFQVISGYYTGDATLTTGTFPEKVSVAFVAPRFLELWGIEPRLGRDFSAEEMRFGGPGAVLISNRFWRTHLASDPHAAGKSLNLGKQSYTIAGVLPASFLFPDRDVDVWIPNPVDAPYGQMRDATWFTVLGRMKPGITLAKAQADLATVQAQLGKQYPKTDADLTVQLQPLKALVIGGIGPSLWLLYGSVSLLLLIACTNIAALLTARTAEREHEISIRSSLGASRSAIIGQLLTEVFVLALAGSLLGLAVASAASHTLVHFAKDIPRVDEVGLNRRMVGYTLVCTLAATFVCGLFPAIRGTRQSLSGSLSRTSRSQVSGRNPWQWILVGVQVSLAVAMLVGSGLLLRSFAALGQVDPGFDPSHVVTLRVSGGWAETMDMGKLTQRINRTLDGLRSLPGVEAAATSGTIPGNSYDYPTEFKFAEASFDRNQKIITDLHFVSTGYFAALHIPLLAGEPCRDGLPYETLLVNRSFVDKYLAQVPAIGYHMEPATANSFMNSAVIRGVVGNAREQGLDTPAGPTVYWCSSAPTPDPHYLIRTRGNPAAIADAVRRRIYALEPGRSVFAMMPLEDHLDDRIAENRMRTILLTLFGATAISLVSIGLYGTISYLGRTRRREVGLRLALGALPGQIVRGFMMQGMRVALVGCVAGLLLGAALSHLLAGMLYKVSPLDPVTYAGVLLLTLLIAGAASLIPSLRAAGVDPAKVLSEE